MARVPPKIVSFVNKNTEINCKRHETLLMAFCGTFLSNVLLYCDFKYLLCDSSV